MRARCSWAFASDSEQFSRLTLPGCGRVRLLCNAMSPSAPQPAAAPAAIYTPEQTAPVLVRLGAWAFRQRSWLPVPLGLAVVVFRTGETTGAWPVAAGLALVA